MNQKAFARVLWRTAMTTIKQSKKAIIFLMTVVTTCLHAEGAKNVPHTYANASWRFWQSWVWTQLDVNQGLGAFGANSYEGANSCLDYEELKVHILLSLVFVVCHHLRHVCYLCHRLQWEMHAHTVLEAEGFWDPCSSWDL